MIARLVALYLAIFAIILAALSIGAYAFVGSQYHSLLLPALSTPEGASAYARAMRRVVATIVAFDIPLLLLVGLAAWALARISIAPLTAARDRERQFVTDIAHELRSPLATISSVAQASRYKSEEEMRAAFELVTATALDANDVVTDLLTLARSPSASVLALEPVDIAGVAGRCTAEFRARAEAAGIDVRAELDSAIVNGDERRLRELLRNLLDNAMRHAHSSIDLTCKSAGSFAVLTVADDGEGVAPDLRDRIFDRFFRNGEAAGTGLGLSIAHWVVQAHGGTIAVRDNAPGAAFTVQIPLLARHA